MPNGREWGLGKVFLAFMACFGVQRFYDLLPVGGILISYGLSGVWEGEAAREKDRRKSEGVFTEALSSPDLVAFSPECLMCQVGDPFLRANMETQLNRG